MEKINNNLYILYSSLLLNKDLILKLLSDTNDIRFIGKLKTLLSEYINLEIELKNNIYPLKKYLKKEEINEIYTKYQNETDNLK